ALQQLRRNAEDRAIGHIDEVPVVRAQGEPAIRLSHPIRTDEEPVATSRQHVSLEAWPRKGPPCDIPDQPCATRCHTYLLYGSLIDFVVHIEEQLGLEICHDASFYRVPLPQVSTTYTFSLSGHDERSAASPRKWEAER